MTQRAESVVSPMRSSICLSSSSRRRVASQADPRPGARMLRTGRSELRLGRRAGRRDHARQARRRHRNAGKDRSDNSHSRREDRGRRPGGERHRAAVTRASIDGTGKTVIPGIIGLHDHMYYGGMQFMGVSYPRLFLSAGVTTIRTTGSVDSYQELNLKRRIDSLLTPGTEHRRHRTVSAGCGRRARRDASALRPRRRPPHGALLGRGGRDVVQGLHADLACGSRRRDRRGAQARREGDRASLLGRIPRGGRARVSTSSSTGCSRTPSITAASKPDVMPDGRATRRSTARSTSTAPTSSARSRRWSRTTSQ